MQTDTKTSKHRLQGYIPRYKRYYLYIIAVWLPFFIILSALTLSIWHKTAQAEYANAHSFIRVHNNIK